MLATCRLDVNGERYECRVRPDASLLDVLRENLDLTGTKRGCDMGACGACTVLLDGRPVMSCLTLALEAEGRAITTVEGLARHGELHPLQRAFVAEGAVQCGYCTPGMLLCAKALLDASAAVTEPEVRRALAGNHCRCTGYTKIIAAVLSVGGKT